MWHENLYGSFAEGNWCKFVKYFKLTVLRISVDYSATAFNREKSKLRSDKLDWIVLSKYLI